METRAFWWQEQNSLPFPAEFATSKSHTNGQDVSFGAETVELRGKEFRWQQRLYASASELKAELLDPWHEQLYPVLDEEALSARRYAAAAATATVDPDVGPTDEAALRATVWQMAAAVASRGGTAVLLPPPLRKLQQRQADWLVDAFGAVIARAAAPESLCWWELSPCFALSRGGLRAPGNLLPLHAAAHRDRRDLILSAVIREVPAGVDGDGGNDEAPLAAAETEAATAEAHGRSTTARRSTPQNHGGGGGGNTAAAAQVREQEQGWEQRFFVVVASGSGAGGAHAAASDGGGGSGAMAAGGAQLRPLRVGPSPAAVAAVWTFVRDALGAATHASAAADAAAPDAHTAPLPASPALVTGDASASGAGTSGRSAAATAEADADAEVLLADLLCSNWAGLPEGSLDRSLPCRQLRLCGGAAAGVAAEGDRPPAAPASASAAVTDLLHTYLRCCCGGATEPSDDAGSGGVSGSGAGEAASLGDGSGGADGGGNGDRLRRARTALAAALGWRPSGGGQREPMVVEGAADLRGGVEEKGGDCADVTTTAAASTAEVSTEAGPAAAASGEERPGAGVAPAGQAAAAATPRARVRRPVGAWLPRARRVEPLSPRHPQPFRHPEDYLLWPAEPQPVARWVLVDARPGAAAEEEAVAGAAAAVVEGEGEEAEPEAGSGREATAPVVGGLDAAAVAVPKEASAAADDGKAAGPAMDSGLELPPSRLFPPAPEVQAGGADGGAGGARPAGAAAERVLPLVPTGDGDGAAATGAAGTAGGEPGAGGDGAPGAATGGAEGLAEPAAAGAEAGDGPGGAGAAADGAALTPAAAARAVERAERAKRAARRRAVAMQAAAAAAGRPVPLASAQPQQQPAQGHPAAADEAPLPADGSGSASQTAASPPPPPQLPGLKNLPPEAAAAMEKAFAAAAAAAVGTSGTRRGCHLRSVPVPAGSGVAATAAWAPPPPLAQAVPGEPAAGRRPRPGDPPADTSVSPAAAEPGQLPGLGQLPPEAAGPLEHAFREAMAGGRRSYHLRGAQVPGARPAAAVSPVVIGAGAAGDGNAAGLGWSSPAAPPPPQHSPRQALPYYQDPGHGYGPKPGDGSNAHYYYYQGGDGHQYLCDPYGPYGAVSSSAAPPAPSAVERCFGLLGPAGHVASRREEQECRVEQYRTFVRLTQYSRPTGRELSGGGVVGG